MSKYCTFYSSEKLDVKCKKDDVFCNHNDNLTPAAIPNPKELYALNLPPPPLGGVLLLGLGSTALGCDHRRAGRLGAEVVVFFFQIRGIHGIRTVYLP